MFATSAAAMAATTASPPSKRRIDFFVGPQINGPRAVGLGGAYAAIAEGVDGQLINPASAAVRGNAFADEWFDWDFGFSALSTFGKDIDLDMSRHGGDGIVGSAQQLGLRLSFGRLGVAVHAVSQRYEHSGVGDDGAHFGFSEGSEYAGIGFGYAFSRGEIVVGTFIAWGVGNLSELRDGGDVVNFASPIAPRSLGILWAPRNRRFRFGASFQLPVRMTQALAATFTGAAVAKLGTLEMPQSIDIAPSLTIGGAWLLFGHGSNRAATFGEMLPPKFKWRGPPVIVAVDAQITGAVEDGVGVPGFLAGAPQRSGENGSLGLRAGAESEVIKQRLRVRTGFYVEPSRYATSTGRLHWTGGGDVRLSLFLEWRVGVVWDVAPAYRNASFSLGLWN